MISNKVDSVREYIAEHIPDGLLPSQCFALLRVITEIQEQITAMEDLPVLTHD